MPRKQRSKHGGARQGVQGATYTNRSDLQQGPRQPVRVAPGQTYGKGVEQQRAQQALPMAAAPPVPPPGAAPGPGMMGPPPGAGGPFNRPTERPDEPSTTGLAMGPGAGPEALAMSKTGGNPDLEVMRPYLPALELMASQPNASPSARNFVRRLRGALGTAAMTPPGATGPGR